MRNNHPFRALWLRSSKIHLLTAGGLNQVVSTLSVLEPFRRAAVGIPFLYQKVGIYP